MRKVEPKGIQESNIVSTPLQVLQFRLDHQTLAIPCSKIREIVSMVAVSPLLDAPPIVEGIFNYRGEIIPIVNIRQRFQMEIKPISPDDCLIILWSKNSIALRVDQVETVLFLSLESVRPLEDVFPGLNLSYSAALTANGILLIYDIDSFLSSNDSLMLEQALNKLHEESLL